MPKQATKWKTSNGYDTVTDDNAGFSLLLENGFNLLLEDGAELLLEGSLVTPKHPSLWTAPAKVRTSWEAADGFSTAVNGVSEARVTEQGDTRITEQGDSRVTSDSEFSRKNPTRWTE